MTKTDARFRLSRKLSDRDFDAIARVRSVFGMLVVRVSDEDDQLFVTYDASRLTLPEVQNVLEQHGIPIQ
jgi:hypothetical protein